MTATDLVASTPISSSDKYSPQYDAIVIGSGIGGLVTATQLAVKGAKVLVLESYIFTIFLEIGCCCKNDLLIASCLDFLPGRQALRNRANNPMDYQDFMMLG
jgi:NAD(P)-binding Rossmann-like domain